MEPVEILIKAAPLHGVTQPEKLTGEKAREVWRSIDFSSPIHPLLAMETARITAVMDDGSRVDLFLRGFNVVSDTQDRFYQMSEDVRSFSHELAKQFS